MVTGVYVYDTAPANTTYVADTTEWSADNVNWTPIGQPDGGVLPISAPGGVLLGDLAPGDSFYVRFRVTLNAGIYASITNCDSVYSDAGDFGNCVTTQVATRDWGDLPDTYGTSAAANGPRHSYDGLTLGALWDIEAQGVPTTAANGDDLAQTDDEDGVINMASGQQWYDGQGSINVTVVGGTGCLNAWFDFTGDAGLALVPDGDFHNLSTPEADDYDVYTVGGTYSEHVIQNLVLAPGTHSISLAGLVPAGLNGGATTSFYARFRLSPLVGGECTTVTPTGYVMGGEIEDYQFPLGWPTNADLGSFTARGLDNAVQLRWVTLGEVDTAGFNLYRARWPKGPKTQVNAELIPSLVAPGSGEGAVYRYRETGLRDKIKYYYWLEVVGLDGTTKRYGPIGVLTQ